MSRRPRSFNQQLVEVLDKIYEVPFSAQGGWQEALQSITEFMGCQASDVAFVDARTKQVPRFEHVRLDSFAVERYIRDYLAENPFIVQPRAPVLSELRRNQIVTDSDTWSLQERNLMPFFAELYFPHGFEEDIAGCANVVDGTRIVLSAHFARRHEAHSQENRHRLKLLLPHVRRACDAEKRLISTGREREAMSAALDHIRDAVTLLDSRCRVVYMNEAAEQIFRKETGIGISSDRTLFIAHAETRAAIEVAVKHGTTAALACDPPAKNKYLLTASEGHSLTLTLQPLSRELQGAFGGTALLFIYDPSYQTNPRSEMLRAEFGLSESENALVLALAEGKTLKGIARVRNVSYETVRSQLRSIFDKTGVRRQSDVVRLAAGLG